MALTRRRVKLYTLNAENQWDDKGTGHVSYIHTEVSSDMLVVRAECDGSVLLESKILPDTNYQRQQDTLIVWCEEGSLDLALSFQEKLGCDDIWEKICRIQGKDSSETATQDVDNFDDIEEGVLEEESETETPIELPPCNLAKLAEITELFSKHLSSHPGKKSLGYALEHDNYIQKLLELFHICEDLENINGLHQLYDIFINLFLLNQTNLFDIMFAEEIVFDLVGVLEYDPLTTSPKRHRDYLRNVSKFIEVIPISNEHLVSKIHQTYRAEYVQDVVLPTPSLFDENMFSVLRSFINCNKMEIVQEIVESEQFLTDLFSLLKEPSTPESKCKDLMLFLKEFCFFSQWLQNQNKEALFRTLLNLGLFQVLETTLKMADPTIKIESREILSQLVNFDPSLVREYAMNQAKEPRGDNKLIVNIIIEQLGDEWEPELGGTLQLCEMLRFLLDPENMNKKPMTLNNASGEKRFIALFYKHCIDGLVAPILLNSVEEKCNVQNYQTAQLLAHIMELLTFFVEHHPVPMKACVLRKDLLRRVLAFIYSHHKFLALTAIRFMRKMLNQKDAYYRYITNGNLFENIIDAFQLNNGTDNLLDSAIIEMFEFIKVENIKPLCTHVIEKYGKVLDQVKYVKTFRVLREMYDNWQLEKIPRMAVGVLKNELLQHHNLLPLIEDETATMSDKILDKEPENKENVELTASSPSLSPLLVSQTIPICSNLLMKKDPDEEAPKRCSPLTTSTNSPNKSNQDSLGESPLKRSREQADEDHMTNQSVSSLLSSTNTRNISNVSNTVETTTESSTLPIKVGLVDYPDESSDEDEPMSPPSSKRTRSQ